MDEPMEACRKIVEVFYRKREGSEDYVVRIEVEPNPLDFDGVDTVSAHVVKKTRVSNDFQDLKYPKVETIILSAEDCYSVEEALEELSAALP